MKDGEGRVELEGIRPRSLSQDLPCRTAPGHDRAMGSFLYFAYGSNMLTERLRARCPSAQPVGTALAANHALDFVKESVDRSGKATLVRRDGVNRYGVLFEIDDRDLPALDAAEGSGYSRIDAFAVLPTGSGSQAEAATYMGKRTTPGLRPYDWYLALVIAGAIQHGVPTEQIRQLRSVAYDITDRNQNARAGRQKGLEALLAAGFGSPLDVLSRAG